MNQPSRTLIVSTSLDARRLGIVLKRALRQTQSPDQLIIAEDGEDAETQRLIHSSALNVSFPLLHVRQSRVGFRKGKILNEAILHATSDLVIFLDGDCAPHPRFIADHGALARPGYFTQGRRSFIEEKGIDAFSQSSSLLKLWVTGRLKRPFKSLRLPFPRIKEDAEHEGALGCNLAVWRSDLEAINGFDEKYEGWGREDADLTARLVHLGRRRRVVWGRAIVFHLNHPIQPRTGLSNNDQRLAAVLAAKSIRANHGLVEHRAAWQSASV